MLVSNSIRNGCSWESWKNKARISWSLLLLKKKKKLCEFHVWVSFLHRNWIPISPFSVFLDGVNAAYISLRCSLCCSTDSFKSTWIFVAVRHFAAVWSCSPRCCINRTAVCQLRCIFECLCPMADDEAVAQIHWLPVHKPCGKQDCTTKLHRRYLSSCGST